MNRFLTILVLAALVAGSLAGAQGVAAIDEPRALLEDERNTVEIVRQFGPSVVAVNVTAPTGFALGILFPYWSRATMVTVTGFSATFSTVGLYPFADVAVAVN